MRARKWFCGLLLLLLSLVSAFAWADGMMFREKSLGTKEVPPTIPYQRAVISHKNGVETLIVESTLNGPEGDYAWIVPVPSPPTVMAKTNKSALDQSVSSSRPHLETDSIFALTYMAVVICAALMLVAIAGPIANKGSRGMRVAAYFAETALVLVVAAIICWISHPYPSPGTAGTRSTDAAMPAKVAVLEHKNVGSFDVSVVKSMDSKTLMDWLETNGFKAPATAKPIVDAYVKDGWCFVAAKLRGFKGGTLPMHPIKLEFATAKPVYPMRLTALAGPEVVVDLFVIGNQFAKARGLEPWFSGILDKTPSRADNPFSERGDLVTVSNLSEEWRNWSMGHPDLVAMSSQDAKWTRLHGTFRPADMKQDISIDWTSKTPNAPVFVTPKAYASYWASWMALGLGAGCWLAGLVVTLMNRFTGWFTLATLGLGVAVLLALPPVALSNTRVLETRSVAIPESLTMLEDRTDEVGSGLEQVVKNRSGERFPEAFRALMKKDGVPEGVLPGGFTVERYDTGWKVTAYDELCAPSSVMVSKEGTLQKFGGK